MPIKKLPDETKQLLAEADELVEQINSDILDNINEEERLKFEQYSKKLEQIKSEVYIGSGDKNAVTKLSHGDGIHEAILDIVKAMDSLKKYLS